MTDLMTVNDVSNVIVVFFFSFGDDVSSNEFDEANALLSMWIGSRVKVWPARSSATC